MNELYPVEGASAPTPKPLIIVGEFAPINPLLMREYPIPALILGPFAIHEANAPHRYDENARGLSLTKSGLRVTILRSQEEAVELAKIFLRLEPDVSKWDNIRARLDKSRMGFALIPKWLQDLYDPSYAALKEYRAALAKARGEAVQG